MVGVIDLTTGGDTLAGKSDDSIAYIDYGLMPAYRGKGIMTKACSALVGYVFDHLAVDRVEIACDVLNIKSCAIPESLRFRKDRVLEGVIEYTPGLIGDLVVYAMTRQKWRAAGLEGLPSP